MVAIPQNECKPINPVSLKLFLTESIIPPESLAAGILLVAEKNERKMFAIPQNECHVIGRLGRPHSEKL